MIKILKKSALWALGIIMIVCLAFGLAACKPKQKQVVEPDKTGSVKKEAPTDGSLPTAHSGIDNLAYMAYVLDNQESYHVYASNSSKASGVTQVTKTWKDYKSQSLTGVPGGVMVCSDISTSSFVKAATQSLFINNEVYMRGGDKPSSSSTCTNENWHTSPPEYYDRESYLAKYGEFSTELSVYILNEETVTGYDEVVTNEDGTYSQKFYLDNNKSVYYYQNGMKTRGGLKVLPIFNKIELTCTFDAQWRVLETYCYEETEIYPSQLGGIKTSSTARTTTTFGYDAQSFDEQHFAYYEDFFKQYVGEITSGGSSSEDDGPEVLDVLAGGFNKVLTTEGQQFDATLKLGDTEYEGKVFLSLDISDPLGTIDARVAVSKKGSGKQDLFISFAKGDIEVYYSEGFAATANIDALKPVISQFGEWINQFKTPEPEQAPEAGEESESSGNGLGDLLAGLKLSALTDTGATVSLVSDNLLGTGIGFNVELAFSRDISSDTFAFLSGKIDSIKYSSAAVDLALSLAPSADSAIISHDKASAPANLADYAASVYGLLDSDVIKLNLDLDGSGDVISYIKGLDVSADAYLKIGSEIAARADVTAVYKGITIGISAYYCMDLSDPDYGKVYITLNEVNGQGFKAKLYCDINETVTAVKTLLNTINGNQGAAPAEITEEAENGIANTVNKILHLNFGRVFGELYANSSEIRLGVNVDEILSGLDVNVGNVKFGSAALKLTNVGGKATLNLTAPYLGLTVSAEGASAIDVAKPATDGYLNVVELVGLVDKAAVEVKQIVDAEDILFDINATLTLDGVALNVSGTGEVVWADGVMRVALDLVLYVQDGTSATARDSMKVKFVYDESVADDKPFVKFTLGDLGLEITRNDIDGTVSGFNEIKDAISKLTGGEKTGNASAQQAVMAVNDTVTAGSKGLDALLEEVLGSENVQRILGVVFDLVNDVTVNLTRTTTDDAQINGLLIRHAINGEAQVTVADGLSLRLKINNGTGTEVLSGTAGVKAGNGGKFTAIEDSWKDITFYTTAEAETAFVHVVYNYLTAVIEDISIKEVLGGETYKVDVTLDGANSDIAALRDNGIKVEASLAYNEADGKLIKLSADVAFAISIEGEKYDITARLAIGYYEGYLLLEVNGLGMCKQSAGPVETYDLHIKAKAATDDVYNAVEYVIDLILKKAEASVPSHSGMAVTDNPVPVEQTKTSLTEIMLRLLNLDFEKAVQFRKVDGENTATFAVDYVLDTLGVDLGFDIGTAKIAINPASHEIKGSVQVEGKDDWLILNAYAAEISGIGAVNIDEYLDLGDLVRMLGKAYDVAIDIIDLNSIVLDIDAQVIADGVTMAVTGNGQVTWKKVDDVSKIRVALDLTAYIQDGTTESKKDSLALKVIYDEAAEKDAPLVRVAINQLGINLFREDIDDTKAGIDALKAAIESLMGSVKSGNATPAEAVAITTGTDAESGAGGTVADILSQLNLQQILKTVLGIADDISMNLEYSADPKAEAVALIVNYAEIGKAKLSTDGDLRLQLDVNNGADKVVALNVGVRAPAYSEDGGVKVATEDKVATLNGTLDTEPYQFYNKAYAEEVFVKSVYNYLFAVIEDLSVKQILGDKTYTVEVKIDGDSSEIPQLAGISVDATLYYTQALDGDSVVDGKIIEGDITLNIKGVEVIANARYSGRTIYISLEKVGKTVILNGEESGIKVKAGEGDVYSAVQQLLELIANPALPDLISGFMGNNGGASVQTVETVPEMTEDTKLSITDLLSNLLSLDFKQAFEFKRVDLENDGDSYHENVAIVHTDYLLSALGVAPSFRIGDVSVNVNPQSHEIRAAITLPAEEGEGTQWASIKAVPAARREYAEGWTEKYMDIGFVSPLISDITNTITDDGGNFYTLYTFSGQLNVHLALDLKAILGLSILPVINKDIPLNLTNFTIGIDGDGDFYFTAIADLSNVSEIFDITQQDTVGISYSKGYLTLGKDLEASANRRFRVMTMDYFLDNMLSKTDSPLQWLLGTNSTLWGYIIDAVGGNINIGSGLTTPRTDYKLYETFGVSKNSNEFDLARYLNGYQFNLGDKQYSYGEVNGAAVNELGLTAEDASYYLFDVNGSGLTSAITKLYAAIMRDKDEYGDYRICGLKASAALTAGPADITITADLSKYLEGQYETFGGSLLNFAETEVLNKDGFFTQAEITEFVPGVNYYTKTANGNYELYELEYNAENTYYVFENDTYYYKDTNGEYKLVTEAFEAEPYYTRAVDGEAVDRSGLAGPNYLKLAIQEAADHGRAINFDYYADASIDSEHRTNVFGAYYSEDNSYHASPILEKVTLKIHGYYGNGMQDTIVYEDQLPYGSTVFMRDVLFPVWADEQHTQKYVFTDHLCDGSAHNNANGEPCDGINYKDLTKVTMDGDKEFWAKVVPVTTIRFYINVEDYTLGNGLDYIEGAFAYSDYLPEYSVPGYTFLGWYNDRAEDGTLSNPVGNSANVKDNNVADGVAKSVFGNYVHETTTVNGVNYKLTSIMNESTHLYTDSYFTVVGFDAEQMSQLGYTKKLEEGGNRLVLENEINGFKVTKIAERAFANASKQAASSIKNIVVPSNITEVGSLAFLDNRGMQSVVFTAEKVTLLGTLNTSSDGNYAFYGCMSENEDGNSTNLNVYYNVINENGVIMESYIPAWSVFNNMGSKNNAKYRYIGHNCTDGTGTSINGKDHYEYTVNNTRTRANGNPWGLVQFAEIEGDHSLGDASILNGILADGMVTGDKVSALKEDIVSAITAVLNAKTYEEGNYINGYDISVEIVSLPDEKPVTTALYGYTSIKVTINQNGDDKCMYKFAYSSPITDCPVSYTVEGEQTTYGGDIVIAKGATVTVTATNGAEQSYTFEGWQADGITVENTLSVTFQMPANAVSLTAKWQLNTVDNIYVNSDIAFDYEGEHYEAGDKVHLTNVANNLTLKAPTAAGYTFAGWAQEKDGSLAFGEFTAVKGQEEATYYAVWVKDHSQLSVSVATSGNTLPVSVNDGYTFYKWYADEAYTTEVSSTVAVQISADNTLFVGRMQYTASFTFSGSDTNLRYSVSDTGIIDAPGKNADTPNKYLNVGTVTHKLTVLEGQTVKISRCWWNNLVFEVGEAGKADYQMNRFVGWKRKGGVFSPGNDNEERTFIDSSHGVTFDTEGWVLNPSANLTLRDGRYFSDVYGDWIIEIASNVAKQDMACTIYF